MRDVEERIGDPAGEFVCECSDDNCEERITMSLEAYERVRTDAIRFAIKRGHEVASLERVVQETADYAVVEKREGEPASIARGDEASPGS